MKGLRGEGEHMGGGGQICGLPSPRRSEASTLAASSGGFTDNKVLGSIKFEEHRFLRDVVIPKQRLVFKADETVGVMLQVREELAVVKGAVAQALANMYLVVYNNHVPAVTPRVSCGTSGAVCSRKHLLWLGWLLRGLGWPLILLQGLQKERTA